MLVGFGIYRPSIAPHTNGLRSGDLNISDVIFKSESQFKYLFTLKNAHLSSKGIILERKQ